MPFALSRLHFWHKKYFVLPSEVHVTGLPFGVELHDGTILEHKLMGTHHIAIYFFKSCGVRAAQHASVAVAPRRPPRIAMLGHRGPVVARTFALAELQTDMLSVMQRFAKGTSFGARVADDEAPTQTRAAEGIDEPPEPRRKGFHFPAFR